MKSSRSSILETGFTRQTLKAEFQQYILTTCQKYEMTGKVRDQADFFPLKITWQEKECYAAQWNKIQ